MSSAAARGVAVSSINTAAAVLDAVALSRQPCLQLVPLLPDAGWDAGARGRGRASGCCQTHKHGPHLGAYLPTACVPPKRTNLRTALQCCLAWRRSGTRSRVPGCGPHAFIPGWRACALGWCANGPNGAVTSRGRCMAPLHGERATAQGTGLAGLPLRPCPPVRLAAHSPLSPTYAATHRHIPFASAHRYRYHRYHVPIIMYAVQVPYLQSRASLPQCSCRHQPRDTRMARHLQHHSRQAGCCSRWTRCARRSATLP